jgi:Protein of unknown function (DUF2829)
MMTFGQALEALKAGERVARQGWNGRGMWIALMPAVVIAADKVNERTRRFVKEGDLNVGAYVVMWTTSGVWQPGWLASQADMLAEDWEIVASDEATT